MALMLFGLLLLPVVGQFKLVEHVSKALIHVGLIILLQVCLLSNLARFPIDQLRRCRLSRPGDGLRCWLRWLTGNFGLLLNAVSDLSHC